MSLTKRLYRERPEDSEFWGAIRSIQRSEDKVGVVLEQTLFYPTSGGQPCDLGTLGGLEIVEVLERSEEGDEHAIVHVVPADKSTKKWYPGRELEGKVDLRRRQDHMEQHSGQHLLSAILLKHGHETLSFHLGAEACSIDVPAESLDKELLRAVETEANGVIRACYPVKVSIHRGEGVTPVGLRKEPPKELYDSPEGLRIVQIGPDEDPVDLDPCCGTHVTNTGMLGAIVILGTERGRKGETKISFAVGRRAMDAVRARLDALQTTGATLTAGFADLPERSGKLLSTVKELKRDLKQARAKLVGYEAEAFASAQEGTVLTQLLDEGDAKEAAAFARACVNVRPDALVGLVHKGERLTLVVARGDGSDLHAGDTLRSVLSAFEGKGGGSPTFAQGAVADVARADELLAAAKAALEGKPVPASASESEEPVVEQPAGEEARSAAEPEAGPEQDSSGQRPSESGSGAGEPGGGAPRNHTVSASASESEPESASARTGDDPA